MGLTKRKIILPLVFLLVILSLLRVLKVAIGSSSFSSTRLVLNTMVPPIVRLKPIRDTVLTQKEIRFLYDIILQKSPCNLLVFGLEEQYLKLPTINGGGSTVFLEDRPEKLKKTKWDANGTRVYRIEYKTYAKNAYKLLKHARSDSSCDLRYGVTTIMSKCKLVLTGLAEDVLKMRWDVIVVDGPGGDGPESPGRMGSIFMAGVLGRGGNGTNVVVHDVDRMIEKWFSWEFLCQENLVSSKGRFWNFRIPQKINNNSRKFCSG